MIPPTSPALLRSVCVLRVLVVSVCLLGFGQPRLRADGDAAIGRPWSELFAEMDRNEDLRVSREEFLASSGGAAQPGSPRSSQSSERQQQPAGQHPPGPNDETPDHSEQDHSEQDHSEQVSGQAGPTPGQVHHRLRHDRDFTMFDFDGDDRLNKLEFALLHTIDSAEPRGPIPDPFDTLASQAMAAIDESYGHWNLRPDETIPVRPFVANFLKSISDDDGEAAVSGRVLQQADPNSDGQVNRDEAFRFLRQQLGISWAETRLRLLDGRVVEFSRFIAADENRNEMIDEQEFASRWSVPGRRAAAEDAQQAFAVNDRNGDRAISMMEFAHPDGPNLFDPVNWFRGADRNLDAYLDRAEMEAATKGPRRELIASSFSGFDDDEDGRLSLQEYRLTMHASRNYPWLSWPLDGDGDERLSLREFQFHRMELFHLQRRFYFHRLDANHDGFLTPDEFVFRIPSKQSMTMTSVDGTQSRSLLTVDGVIGSPQVSPDGAKILFDYMPDANLQSARVAMLEIGSGKVTELCDGQQPSWGPDGSQFVCCQNKDRQEIWMMDSQGQPQRKIAEGWSPRWSPDGERVAFLNDTGLCSVDLASGQQRTVVRQAESGYRYFWWSGCWSPDSKQMVVRGDRLRHSDVVIINMEGPPVVRTRFSSSLEMGTWFAWSPDADRIVFPMRNPSERRTQLFQIDPHQDTDPIVVQEVDRGFEPSAGCITPDGLWYICVWQSFAGLPEEDPGVGSGGRM